jgi:hypothetical protein
MIDVDDDLQRQLSRWADDLAASVPPYRRLEQSTITPRTARRRPPSRLVVVAIAACAVIVVGALWRARDDASRVTTQAPVMVLHEQIEVRLSADLLCQSVDSSGTFDRATVDTWADTEGRRYRTRVTHPDGSTYDVIALGSPYYPTALYERGQSRLGPLGCGDGFLVREAEVTIIALNPLAEVPRRANGDPLAFGLFESTTPVDGAYTDSLGRPAALREGVITGFYTGLNVSLKPVRQTTRVFVDPATGQINEATFTNVIEDVGRLERISTRTLSTLEPATDELFDHDGYKKLPGRAPPVDDGSPRPSTVVGSTTTR